MATLFYIGSLKWYFEQIETRIYTLLAQDLFYLTILPKH